MSRINSRRPMLFRPRSTSRNAYAALCNAKVVAFDATDFELAIMFLAGIRAVVRRGVTLLSVGGDHALGKELAIPSSVSPTQTSSRIA